MTYCENLENTLKELHRIIDLRFETFGKHGTYDKPKFTKTGRETKNRNYNYPHKSELLDIKRRLLDVKKDDYDSIKRLEKEVGIFIIITQDEFIKYKNMK